MLERTKGIATLAAAWPLVATALPGARLVIVGRGAQADLVDRLRDDFPDSVDHVERLQPAEVAAAHGRGDLPRPPVAQRRACRA